MVAQELDDRRMSRVHQSVQVTLNQIPIPPWPVPMGWSGPMLAEECLFRNHALNRTLSAVSPRGPWPSTFLLREARRNTNGVLVATKIRFPWHSEPRPQRSYKPRCGNRTATRDPDIPSFELGRNSAHTVDFRLKSRGTHTCIIVPAELNLT